MPSRVQADIVHTCIIHTWHIHATSARSSKLVLRRGQVPLAAAAEVGASGPISGARIAASDVMEDEAEKQPERDKTPDTPPTEPEPVPIRDPPDPPEKRGPIIVSVNG